MQETFKRRLEERINRQLHENIDKEKQEKKAAKNNAFCQHQSGLIKRLNHENSEANEVINTIYSARNMKFRDLPDQGKEERRLIQRLQQSEDAA